MDEVAAKAKDWMKQIYSPFDKKFKGTGHRLGSVQDHGDNMPPHRTMCGGKPSGLSTTASSSQGSCTGSVVTRDGVFVVSERKMSNPDISVGISSAIETLSCADGHTTKRAEESFKPFLCPVCERPFSSEEEISVHVEACLKTPAQEPAPAPLKDHDGTATSAAAETDMKSFFDASCPPSREALDTIRTLLGNILKDPTDEKRRRFRMGNPRISRALAQTRGAIEMFLCLGFVLDDVATEEGGTETWLTLKSPPSHVLRAISDALAAVDSCLSLSVLGAGEAAKGVASSGSSCGIGPAAVAAPTDRQVRVYLPAPESLAAKIEVPDSFFSRTSGELRDEALARRKQMERSQVLMTRAMREKQASAGKRMYSYTKVRVYFPDGVTLEGVFRPTESTTALYKFVGESLKNPAQEFYLVHPIPTKHRILPSLPSSKGETIPTLDEAGLVPSALLKFRPMETDTTAFVGLMSSLLVKAEPFA